MTPRTTNLITTKDFMTSCMTTPLTERHQGSADILLGMAADNHFIYRASMYRIGNDQTRLKEPGVCDGGVKKKKQDANDE
jgi:hypothetical protein